MTINRNSGQATTTFHCYIKNTLYDMYLLEQGKEIGINNRKLVGYRFSLLQINIYFEDIMFT